MSVRSYLAPLGFCCTFQTEIIHLHTYIIDLVPHSTYVVCGNFIHNWRDLQFKVDSERQIFFEKLFKAILFTPRVFSRNLSERKSPKKYFLYFLCLAWGSNPGFTSNKPTYYLLGHGDFCLIVLLNQTLLTSE